METPYIIAEIANSHEGEFEKAKELIQKVADTGANGIKFQIIIADELFIPNSKQCDHFRKFEFGHEQWIELFSLSRKAGLDIWTDVFGLKGLTITDNFNDIHGYKIHTSDILNAPLLNEVGKRGRPVLLSCGGSTDLEVARAINILKQRNKDLHIILMHGFQSYPTPIHETHMRGLQRLRSVFGLPVGIMDHNDANSELATVVPIIALAFEVDVIEKHITLNRSLKGIDYYASLNPDEFKTTIGYIRSLTCAMGSRQKLKKFSNSEHHYAVSVKKKVIAAKDLQPGHIIRACDLDFKRTDEAIYSVAFSEVLGKKVTKNIECTKSIHYSHLETKITAIVTLINKSSIFPNRYLQKINGKEAFSLIAEQLQKIESINRVILCTSNLIEDDRLYEAALEHNLNCIRVNEMAPVYMVGALLRNQKIEEEIILHVPGNNILVDSELIEKGISEFKENNSEYLTFSGLPEGCQFDIFNKRTFLQLWPYIQSREGSRNLGVYLNKRGLINTTVIESGFHAEAFDISLSSKKNFGLIQDYLARVASINNDSNKFTINIASLVKYLKKNSLPTDEVIKSKLDNNVDFKKFLQGHTLFEEPLVTIYIPTYNYGKYLEKSIKSIFDQTFHDWELIIINDGSDDETESILQKYAANPKIKIIHQENKGLTRSSNLAIRIARGDYIMRLDADDYLDENALMVMANFMMANPTIDMVYPDYYLVSKEDQVLSIVRRKKVGREVELLDLPAHGACTMFKLNSVRKVVGYNEEIDREDEFDLWIRCHKIFNIDNINLPLFYYRRHGEALTDNQQKISETKRKIVRKHAEETIKKTLKNPLRLGIIPVRAHTDLGYHLHLKEIAGRTLLEWAILSAADLFDKLVVVSEDEEILKYTKEHFGNVYPLLRPQKLARQNVSIRSTIEFVLGEVEQKGRVYDIIALLYPEFPLRTEKYVQQALDTLVLFDVDSITDIRETYSKYYTHGKHGLKSLSGKNELRLEQDVILEGVGSILVIKRSNLNSNSHIGIKRGHIPVLKEESYGVHAPIDFKIAEMILKSR